MDDAQLIRQTTATAVDCSQVADWSCQAGWDIEYHQIGRGAFAAWFSVASGDGMLFTDQFCNRELVMSGCPPARMAALVMPAGPQGLGVFEGRSLEETEGILLLPESERTLRSFADARICTFSMPRQRLESILRLHGRDPVEIMLVSRSVVFQPRVLRLITETVSAIAASETGSLSQAGMAVQEDQLLQALADTLDTRSSSREKQARRLSNRKRYVDRARKYIEEQLNEPISISRVAEHINVTPRTLEFAFQEVLGVTPLHYLRSRRLNRVRKLLINNSGKHSTIARLACENGFCHLGNFTRDYKTLFGELPSQTLKNRREL